jgi:hypothetical protein
MNRRPLPLDAFWALQRMKHDLYAVGAVACYYGSARERALLALCLRMTAAGAARAFSADGARRDAAWKHIVHLIDELLRYRLQYPSSADSDELERLQAFVRENADAFETPRLHVVTRSATG